MNNTSFGRRTQSKKTQQPPAASPVATGAPSQKQSSSNGNDRGRQADSPTHIPAKGWKDVAARIYHGISEDRVIAISAGVTFFTLLALFPGIAGLISLYGLVADPATFREPGQIIG